MVIYKEHVLETSGGGTGLSTSHGLSMSLARRPIEQKIKRSWLLAPANHVAQDQPLS